MEFVDLQPTKTKTYLVFMNVFLYHYFMSVATHAKLLIKILIKLSKLQ